jgi:hypothetical protein
VDLRDLSRTLVNGGVGTHVAAGFSRRIRGRYERAAGGDTQTIFDLASLTKPVCALAVATLAGLREAALAEQVSAARETVSAAASVELLLAHRAGLAAHASLYEPLVTGAPFDVAHALGVAARARRTDVTGSLPPEGAPPVYSDLGYLLAGRALAEYTQTVDAGEAMRRRVLAPLGIDAIFGTAAALGLASRGGEVAPTEDVSWRGGVLRGVVHDENAWAMSGLGGSGHAGMFGTVEAVLKLGEAALDLVRGRPCALGALDISWMVRERPGGTLRAGFDGKSATGSSAGTVLGPGTFGHLGFTGTSVWIDPEQDIVVALLTNRVFPSRDNTKIREARPFAHDALARAALR